MASIESCIPRRDEISLPHVSVVVIGRNEARHLPACIGSIRAMDYPQDHLQVLYVDTDSIDGSPEVARSLHVAVYEEHSPCPSPGRARNRGWREAKYDIVHFVDGDILIDPLYLRTAVQYLGDHVVCVIGRLEERNASRSLIAHILQYPWKIRNPGLVDAPGAGGTFIRSVLSDVDGYHPDLLRGEETELGYRLRTRGYSIVLLEHPMGIHDYGIGSFGGLWTRYRVIGHHFARILQVPPSPSLRSLRQKAVRILIQGILSLLVFTGCALSGLAWIALLPPVLITLYVPLRYWRPSEHRMLRIVHFMLEYHFKPAIWLGMIEWFLASWQSQR